MMERQFINPEGVARPGVYTPAVVVSGARMIYVSGQISQDADGNLVGQGDLEAQTQQVYKNLQLTLGAAGASFMDVVKLNVYVVDYKNEYREILQRVRGRYVSKDHPPASTLVGVQALARPGLLVEIEAVAAVT